MRYLALVALLGCDNGGALNVASDTPTDGTAGTTNATTTTSTSTTTPPTSTGDCAVSSTLEVVAVSDSKGIRPTDVLVEITLSEEADVAVVCEASDDPSEQHLMEGVGASSYSLQLQALLHDTTYVCDALPTCPASAEAPVSFQFTTGPIPSDMPEVEVQTNPAYEPTPGYLLTQWKNRGGCGSNTAVVMYDTEGNLRWYQTYPFGSADTDTEVLIHDNQLVVGGAGVPDGVHFFDMWSGTSEVAAFPDTDGFHHDGKLLPDGRVMALFETVNRSGFPWIGFGLKTMDPATGEVDWSYDSQEAVDAGDLPVGGSMWDDTYHANWMDWVEEADGPTVYVSLCFAWQIIAIDPLTNEVKWNFGRGQDFALQDASGAPLDDSEFPQCQHGLEYRAEDQTLLVYDNGQARDRSSASLYHIDHDALIATKLWDWNDPTGWREDTLGDIDWLDSGRVLITQAHPECWNWENRGDHSEIVEVDPATDEVWWRMKFTRPNDNIYRSERYNGCELFSSVTLCPERAARLAEIAPLLEGS